MIEEFADVIKMAMTVSLLFKPDLTATNGYGSVIRYNCFFGAGFQIIIYIHVA